MARQEMKGSSGVREALGLLASSRLVREDVGELVLGQGVGAGTNALSPLLFLHHGAHRASRLGEGKGGGDSQHERASRARITFFGWS